MFKYMKTTIRCYQILTLISVYLREHTQQHNTKWSMEQQMQDQNAMMVLTAAPDVVLRVRVYTGIY